MTTTKAAEVARRKSQPIIRTSFVEDLERELRAMVVRVTTVRFPNPKYRRDPVAFFREILGVEPWSAQIEIVEAVRDNARVAVCSGHKIGKSASVVGLALWYYCSFPDARVVLSSTTSRQVDQILWRELRMIRARSGRCVACKLADPDHLFTPRPCLHSALIDGEQGELARTGLKSDDFREIVGFTARESEAVAGISGRNLLFLIDEASGVPDPIYEALAGNMAGGAKIVLVGNGTRNAGEFFEAFHSKAHLYRTIRVSSETTPNVLAGEIVIPGLATRDWIEEKKIEWGEASALYLVRVKGEHALNEEGRLFSLHEISESEARWNDAPDAGRLYVGIDPAGETTTGDESAFVARRGLRMLQLQVFRGLTADAHVVHLLSILKALRVPRETPVVVVDRGGAIGTQLHARLCQYVEDHPHAFDVIGIRPSDNAVRMPKAYDRMRDELAANLRQWMRDGGAILEDVKLAKELHSLEMKEDLRQRLKLIPKDVLRKTLGRSPDRTDALMLAVWEPLSLRAEVSGSPPINPAELAQRHDVPVMDPYAGAALWQKR